MTDSPAGDEDTVEATPDDTAPAADATDEPRHWAKSRGLWVALLVAALVIGGGVFGFVKYRQVSDQLAQLRQAQADRAAAAQLARDYAMKSLTYTFEDPDAFFRAVEDGVSQQLKDKYVNATDLLKAVMLQAQVSSSGEVLATDPVLQPDGSYEVVVSAHQTTRNLQNPTPKVSIILLRVTVNKVGDGWQVTDIGPKTGTKAPEEQQLPGAAPPAPSGGPGAGPAPAPAPTKPAPRP
ncbi:hypothetical protein [Mycobacterium sp. shizuoka-1]|uniref:hypothetical protein n=1 Tax=Mycobacterium sp. shizuoka-1 TaxID=2039281 RepID=UPI001E62D3F0|nr:hypothetical protein [Mycobacterium sp. shizuoka-1]